MEVAVSAARWVVGKALGPVADGLLEAWAASAGLGPNIDVLKMELLYAQGMLDNAQGRDVRSPALKELLHKLRRLAYDADDVLDELDYFRIQDELDGTYHAADVHAGGCVHGLVLNARHTARAVASKLKLSSCSRDASRGDPDGQEDDAKQGCLSGICSCGAREISSAPPPASDQGVQEVDRGCMPKVASSARDAAHAAGKHFPCYSFPSVHDDAHTGTLESSNVPVSGRRFLCGAWTSKARQRDRAVQTPKLKFDRVEMSRKMKDIVEQLKPVCAKVSTILNLELLGSNRTTRSTTQDIAMNRPKTTPAIIEPTLYGRENQKKSIADSITRGEYCAKELTVLPIVGPGGIGKTTFTQHLYDEVKSHFQVPVWICVSLDFNANRLLQEIVKKIPEVNGEKKNCSEEELIEQRLQSKRFLLVLDDMWTYHEDEWKKLLAPFKKGGIEGNMVIVTTRIPEVANMVRTIDCSIELERLSPEDIMCFFEACVFGDQLQPWEGHDDLHGVGKEIVPKLKGFPLAAKTVGRLLRNQLALDHWTRVLDSKEWELQTNDDDIMPALKLSYDCLPFHLQQCFSYCALFPEDYKFGSEELIHLWIGLGLLEPSGQNKRIEDIGLSYLNDLVNHGFFKKEEKENGSHYYVIHDLLHELATKVSSYECLSIRGSNVRSMQIPPSIRHMSIIIDESDVSDRMTFEDCKTDLSTLDKRLKVEKLRTLMLFGEYHVSFAKTFGDLFREAKALRVILLSEANYTMEDVLHNLSKFLHLRYLRITTRYSSEKVSLRCTMARFYHLRVLDLKQCNDYFGFPRDMSNLVKLRHFLIQDNAVHSSIFEVGKLNFLQELRSFMVVKENKGFELRQIGQLVEVGGSLGIYNLEKVKGKEEAHEAKLIDKNHLHELILCWDINRSSKDPTREEHVLESLKPHSNLRALCIRGHGGTNCPTWLDMNFSTKRLESLCLEDVAWNKLPPLGELWMVDEPGDECRGCITGQSFDNLKRLELVKISRLKKWVGIGTCHLFSHLEVLIIKDCSELMELSFSCSTCCQPQQEADVTWFPKLRELEIVDCPKLLSLLFSCSTCCQPQQETNMTWFPKLRELEIVDCPKLLSLPPIPWTSTPCSAMIVRAGSGFEELRCRSEAWLRIMGNGGQDSMFWKVLAFFNLAELKELCMEKCPPLPLDHLQMLTSLKIMKIRHSSNVLSPVPSESNAIYQFPVERIEIRQCGASGKELTQLFSHFPKLTELEVWFCEKKTVLGVVEQQTTATPASPPSSSANKMDDAEIGGGEEIAAAGLLLLPPQLQELSIWGSPELSLRSNSLDDGTAGGGLQSLQSLRSLHIESCPKFLSSYSFSSSGSPFPTSLQDLTLDGVEGMETLAPLSNLTSMTQLAIYRCGDLRGEGLCPLLAQGRLTYLVICDCGDLRGEGLWPLLAQGCLTKLVVLRTPKFFVGSEHEQGTSSKLLELKTDDVKGLLVAPICTLLSTSLTNLEFSSNEEVERFTKEQEDALHLLTSLQELQFSWCDKLQSLPAGVHRLGNLRILQIFSCPAIRSLPKDGLPSSLQELNIRGCPDIRSLPKDGLPSSLRVLDVRYCGSEELRRRCHKLSGTIPIISE